MLKKLEEIWILIAGIILLPLMLIFKILERKKCKKKL
jgi:RNAse (barnase) inhibitor barstar